MRDAEGKTHKEQSLVSAPSMIARINGPMQEGSCKKHNLSTALVKIFRAPVLLSYYSTNSLGVFKKNLNASTSFEHPPLGEKLSNDLGGDIGCRDNNSSWYQKDSPM